MDKVGAHTAVITSTDEDILLTIIKTHGIAAKIGEAWEGYWDNDLGKVAGVDSMGHLVDTDKRAGEEEKQVYKKMMTRW